MVMFNPGLGYRLPFRDVPGGVPRSGADFQVRGRRNPVRIPTYGGGFGGLGGGMVPGGFGGLGFGGLDLSALGAFGIGGFGGFDGYVGPQSPYAGFIGHGRNYGSLNSNAAVFGSGNFGTTFLPREVVGFGHQLPTRYGGMSRRALNSHMRDLAPVRTTDRRLRLPGVARSDAGFPSYRGGFGTGWMAGSQRHRSGRRPVRSSWGKSPIRASRYIGIG